MTEEFVLAIERTGVVKHITFSMVLTWETKEGVISSTKEETKEGVISSTKEGAISSTFETYDPKKDNRPTIILKDGIVEWMQENLENAVYGRCASFEKFGGFGGPELLFGSEADRSLFVLKWL